MKKLAVTFALLALTTACGGSENDEEHTRLAADANPKACRCFDVRTELVRPDGCAMPLMPDGSWASLPDCIDPASLPHQPAPANDTRRAP